MIKVPDVECLFCKRKGVCVTDSDRIETIEDIIIRPIICQLCGKSWKDFYEKNNDSNSILLQIQRNSSDNNSKSDNRESNDTVSE